MGRSDNDGNDEGAKATVMTTETEPMEVQSEVEIHAEDHGAGGRQEAELEATAPRVTEQTILA